MAEPDIPNSKKPVIPDSDRESSDIACEWIPAFAGMTNVGNECIVAVGNVLAIYNANSTGRGNELYYFTQDAFGNELTTSPFSGSSWSTARTVGITEHQTGKWIDPFTGLYYFHARWYDSGVGRFVGRDPAKVQTMIGGTPYEYCLSRPTGLVDISGAYASFPAESANTSFNSFPIWWKILKCSWAIGNAIDEWTDRDENQDTINGIKELIKSLKEKCLKDMKNAGEDFTNPELPDRNLPGAGYCECRKARKLESCKEMCKQIRQLGNKRKDIAEKVIADNKVIKSCTNLESWRVKKLINTALDAYGRLLSTLSEANLTCICELYK